MTRSLPAMTPERAALWIGLVFGLLFVFLTPPFQVPDENNHFRRAYLISEGDRLVPGQGGMPGAYLPASLEILIAGTLQGLPFVPGRKLAPGTLRAALAIPLAPDVRTFVPIRDMTVYSAVPYLPQALGAWIGRLCRLPPLLILYACRLLNFLAALALVVAAVRIAPFCRWLFAGLALTPMAMFLRSSVSQDALTFAAAALVASAVLALAWGPPPARGRLAIFFAASSLLVLSKGAYFLLPFAAVLVPRQRLGSARRQAAAVAVFLVVVTGGMAISSWTVARSATQVPVEIGTSPAAQARVIVARPLRLVGVAARDYVDHLVRYAVAFVGNLGWLDTPLPKVVLVGWALLLVALALTDGPPAIALPGWKRLALAAIVAGTLLIISASQYMTFTPLGADVIGGIQGRYFLPLAPTGSLLLWNRKLARDLSSPLIAWSLFAACALASAVALARMLLRYYGS